MSHQAGSEVIRASLWIRPTGAAYDRVSEAQRRVQQAHNGPAFLPHLSLLSGIESTRADAERRLKRFASQLQPFEIQLGDVGWRDEYFRCLYVNVLLSRELEAAQRLAHELFEMNPPEPFEPHISLHYGELDLFAKRALADEIGVLDVSFTATRAQLVTAASGIPVSEWRPLNERRFGVAGARVQRAEMRDGEGRGT